MTFTFFSLTFKFGVGCIKGSGDFIFGRNGEIGHFNLCVISSTRSDMKGFDCEFCSVMSVIDPH